MKPHKNRHRGKANLLAKVECRLCLNKSSEIDVDTSM